jgi:phenylpropionate dioxygenase-like ring-hydroxylating dioxygenase large terminal subunit
VSGRERPWASYSGDSGCLRCCPTSCPLRITRPCACALLGEDLVAFRASNNKIGVVEAHCPHRGASLYFGRNVECGIRCVYHGWKFEVDGLSYTLSTQMRMTQ